MPQALFCRWFQPTVLNTGGKASSSVGFIPFHNIPPEKGLKPTEESGKAGKFNYPSVETDGKREPTACYAPHGIWDMRHGIWYWYKAIPYNNITILLCGVFSEKIHIPLRNYTFYDALPVF